MDQGLLMFDEKDVVQVCNQRAVELLDLPADLMASRPRFADVLEHQKQCGEFSTSDIVIARNSTRRRRLSGAWYLRAQAAEWQDIRG
jgi:PAS domain-containing protein